jgi:hypothetical protein
MQKKGHETSSKKEKEAIKISIKQDKSAELTMKFRTGKGIITIQLAITHSDELPILPGMTEMLHDDRKISDPLFPADYSSSNSLPSVDNRIQDIAFQAIDVKSKRCNGRMESLLLVPPWIGGNGS